MDALSHVKMWIGGLPEVGLMPLAQAILAALPVGGSLPLFDGVVGNMIGLVKEPGSNGLVGLIALGLIMWIFSKRALT